MPMPSRRRSVTTGLKCKLVFQYYSLVAPLPSIQATVFFPLQLLCRCFLIMEVVRKNDIACLLVAQCLLLTTPLSIIVRQLLTVIHTRRSPLRRFRNRNQYPVGSKGHTYEMWCLASAICIEMLASIIQSG